MTFQVFKSNKIDTITVSLFFFSFISLIFSVLPDYKLY
jgi:hypothetical protein